MRYRLSTILLTALLVQAPGALAATEEDVEFLLNHVADSGCTFVRNGIRYDGKAAADHLRMKYEADKRHIHSGEDFIDRLASASSLSGQPYVVSCGGQTETSRDWLHEALVVHQNTPKPNP